MRGTPWLPMVVELYIIRMEDHHLSRLSALWIIIKKAMSKLTLNQVREKTRNEVARQYSAEIGRLKDRIKQMEQKESEHYLSFCKMREAYDELQEENRMMKEWCERLQDFVNLSDEDRCRFVEEFKKEQQGKSAMREFCEHSAFSKYLSMFDISGMFVGM